MTSVLNCITVDHSPWAVLFAVLFCVAGFRVTLRLLERVVATERRQRLGWIFLAGIAAGSTAWCTHFIALLGFRPDEPIHFNPAPILAALLIGIVGTQLGFLVATRRFRGAGPLVGGGLVGVSILVVHLCGLASYRVDGLVRWNWVLVAVAAALAIGFGMAGLRLAVAESRAARPWSILPLVAMVIGSYFGIATAFEVMPLPLVELAPLQDAFQPMAVAVAAVGMVILSTGLASVVIDRHARSDSFERLHHMAMHDALTGLPNRNSFKDHLDQQIIKARQGSNQFAVIGIDLDRFKEINDQRGHQAGDEALRILARRLTELAGADEYVARLGGDEFVAIRPFSERAELVEFLSRLKSAFYSPVRLDDFEITTGASLGVALYPQDGQTREALVCNSDLAMYRAKSDPLRAICFYDSSMDDVVRQQRVLANDLRTAIDTDALEVHYQVQRSLSGGQITGFEALARWKHPRHGFIAPAEFIPLAEESGLIHRLGEFVLRRACTDAMGWVAPYKVAVNLSALQLSEPTFADLVRDVLAQSGLPAHRLELELTESSLMKDGDRSIRAMQRVKELGVRIALDDFGTGYSSLATLRTFPIDKIKLDRTFIGDVETCPESIAIVRAVLALGKSLRIPVLAEGIERQNQLAILRAEGCDEAQGFLFGCPVPLRALTVAGRSLVGRPGIRAGVGAATTASKGQDAVRDGMRDRMRDAKREPDPDSAARARAGLIAAAAMARAAATPEPAGAARGDEPIPATATVAGPVEDGEAADFVAASADATGTAAARSEASRTEPEGPLPLPTPDAGLAATDPAPDGEPAPMRPMVQVELAIDDLFACAPGMTT